MLLSPELVTTLRPYIVTRLSTVSEADNDVLADYVLELLKSDGDDESVRRTAKEQLAEFLPEHGQAFVDDVFAEIARSTGGGSSRAGAGESGYGSGTGNGHGAVGAEGYGNGYAAGGDRGGYARKRARDDGDEIMADAGSGYARGGGFRGGRGDRPVKSARYGGGRGRGRGGMVAGSYGQPQQQQQQQQQQFGIPNMPFDANDPMAAMMAMQAFLSSQGMVMPDLGADQGQQAQRRARTGKRCRDYDNKGVCTRGANCPYDHGDDFEEYDPGTQRQNGRGRGAGRGRGDRGGRGGRGGRAEFSHAGPMHNTRVKSLVVENIPDENLNDESIRGFFSDFGAIEDVSIDAGGKRLAVIKFADAESARAAYGSPKVVFDNRFVKVYWYKPEVMASSDENGARAATAGEDTEMSTEQPTIDLEVFAKQQAAAQERFESLKAAKSQREELEAKMKAQADEREKLMKMLASKTKPKATSGGNGTSTEPVGQQGMSTSSAETTSKSSQTEALRAQLAALEAEARSIGINPNVEEPYPSRGGMGRGRGTYVPRGRGRGGFGRGAWRGGAAALGGAVKRLDNRPRCVSVVFADGKAGSEETDEGLKQFLLFTNQIQAAKITNHPLRPDAALVAFTERYRAEAFLAAVVGKGSELPHVGRVEVGWVANADVPSGAFPEISGANTDAANGGAVGAGDEVVNGTWEDGAGDERMEDDGDGGEEGGRTAEGRPLEMDYDVADDDERWLVQ